jgi:hypothetical protein
MCAGRAFSVKESDVALNLSGKITGGGSTELVTIAHDGPGVIESLPIGSLGLRTRYVTELLYIENDNAA